MILTKSDIKTRLDNIIIELFANGDTEEMVLKLMRLSTDIGEEINGQ